MTALKNRHRIHFTVTLDSEVVEQIKELAKRDPDKLPLSRVVERIFREAIRADSADEKLAR